MVVSKLLNGGVGMGRGKEVSTYESRFRDEIIEIAAITGAVGIGAGKAGGAVMWRASISLVAWKELNPSDGSSTTDVNQETVSLEWLADDEQWKVCRDWLESDSVVKLSVRRSIDHNSFMLVEVLEASHHDEELAQLLQKMLEPVLYEDKLLGEFALNRSIHTFEKYITWANEVGTLYFDQGEVEEMEASLATAHALFNDQDTWSKKIRSYAAEELVELANDWLADDEDAELDEITEEIFVSRLTLSSITVSENGDFTIYYDDGDLFWGHVIIVEGNINGTFETAQIAG